MIEGESKVDNFIPLNEKDIARIKALVSLEVKSPEVATPNDENKTETDKAKKNGLFIEFSNKKNVPYDDSRGGGPSGQWIGEGQTWSFKEKNGSRWTSTISEAGKNSNGNWVFKFENGREINGNPLELSDKFRSGKKIKKNITNIEAPAPDIHDVTEDSAANAEAMSEGPIEIQIGGKFKTLEIGSVWAMKGDENTPEWQMKLILAQKGKDGQISLQFTDLENEDNKGPVWTRTQEEWENHFNQNLRDMAEYSQDGSGEESELPLVEDAKAENNLPLRPETVEDFEAGLNKIKDALKPVYIEIAEQMAEVAKLNPNEIPDVFINETLLHLADSYIFPKTPEEEWLDDAYKSLIGIIKKKMESAGICEFIGEEKLIGKPIDAETSVQLENNESYAYIAGREITPQAGGPFVVAGVLFEGIKYKTREGQDKKAIVVTNSLLQWFNEESVRRQQDQNEEEKKES